MFSFLSLNRLKMSLKPQTPVMAGAKIDSETAGVPRTLRTPAPQIQGPTDLHLLLHHLLICLRQLIQLHPGSPRQFRSEGQHWTLEAMEPRLDGILVQNLILRWFKAPSPSG